MTDDASSPVGENPLLMDLIRAQQAVERIATLDLLSDFLLARVLRGLRGVDCLDAEGMICFQSGAVRLQLVSPSNMEAAALRTAITHQAELTPERPGLTGPLATAIQVTLKLLDGDLFGRYLAGWFEEVGTAWSPETAEALARRIDQMSHREGTAFTGVMAYLLYEAEGGYSATVFRAIVGPLFGGRLGGQQQKGP